MVMSFSEQTAYVEQELNQLAQRLCGEGVDVDLIYATMVNQAAYGFANMEGAELMPDMFRRTADEMEAGEYKHATVVEPPRPVLTVIEGGGSKV